jgi:lipid II:glycine glycyltransferase (peptidoglycan interpeptide bridge formation enzyme)
MLSVKIKMMRFLHRKIIWYSSKPTFWNCFTTLYKQSSYDKLVFGYKKELFLTKIINLQEDTDTIQKAFDKNTNYEIRRAIKDGVITSTEQNLDRFIFFYNQFSETKKLPKLNYNNLKHYNSNLLITKAIYNNDDVVMHSYVLDKSLKRARLLHSSSLYRNEDSTNVKATIGRANRLLHLTDIKYLKDLGFIEYDLGGYATNIENEAMLNINKFKDSFGGELKKENDYLPYVMVLMSKIF